MDLDLDELGEVEGAFRLAATTTGRGELYEPLAGAVGQLGKLLARFEGSSAGMVPCGYEEHEAVWQGDRVGAALRAELGACVWRGCVCHEFARRTNNGNKGNATTLWVWAAVTVG